MYHDLLMDAAERGIRYREGLDEQRVAPTPEMVARLAELGGPLPDGVIWVVVVQTVVRRERRPWQG